jgi:hypothetical protein
LTEPVKPKILAPWNESPFDGKQVERGMMRAVLRILGIGLLLTLTAMYAQAATIWNGPRIPLTSSGVRTRRFRSFGSHHAASLARRQQRRLVQHPAGVSVHARGESGGHRVGLWHDRRPAEPQVRELSSFTADARLARGQGCSRSPISEDIYIDIKILSWVAASGNVTYERATLPGGLGTGTRSSITTPISSTTS